MTFRIVRAGLAVAALLGAALAAAAGKPLEVKIERDGRYAVDSFILGYHELIGYLGDLHETEGLEAVAVVGNGRLTPEKEAEFIAIAGHAGVKPFVKEGRSLRPLGDAANEPAQ